MEARENLLPDELLANVAHLEAQNILVTPTAASVCGVSWGLWNISNSGAAIDLLK